MAALRMHISQSAVSVQVQHLERALVENGFGITILPRTALDGINLSKLQIVRLQPEPIREVGIVTMRNLSPSPAARSFKEFLASPRHMENAASSHFS